MNKLILSGVARSFGDIQAVRDVSFELPAGSTLGLLGPNGAGKTTTMRMILGILVPDRGTLTWNGEPIDLSVRRRFGYLPEERGLYAKMRVRDQIAYFGRLHGVHRPDDRTRADAWIELLGLRPYADRKCGELSKGNQQKVQIASAALHQPELLVLDEPFSGLDPVNAEILLDALRTLRTAGTTLIISSHQMWQVEELCERFCIIASGTVKAAGTLPELRAQWPTRVIEVEPATDALRAVFARDPLARALYTNGRATLAYEVPADTDAASLLRDLVAAGDVTRFERVEPRLNDIYLRAVGPAA
ncbi:putative ABC transporter ATP-binding protein YhaQ [Vulcanimicrobium alpinum]|uniref:ABC transporter ATP-binding protein YhaQ n=1 Tax=Vulcanimicrobium alpinum TaxID=3016050 RepID=A0AAN2C7H7_UNVUL|nr:ATP-binding cassette domain-containing protein [Vulcanimicrobium alpinum]BDE04935.1 putative ABC transporter ATP-binding protein YhaQ [Vulcanimicrobium alpinum]